MRRLVKRWRTKWRLRRFMGGKVLCPCVGHEQDCDCPWSV